MTTNLKTESKAMPNPILSSVAVAAKPYTGPLVTLSSTILWWIAAITPYVAFAGLCLGVWLTIRSLVKNKVELESARLIRDKLKAEIAEIEARTHAK